MKTVTKLQHIIDLSQQANDSGETMYIRWSRGPVLDKKQGASMDYTNYQRHNGLSAQPVRHDDPELLAQMLPEYKFLCRKDEKIYCWIFTGQENGTDSDGAPTIDAETIKPVAKVSEELIKRCGEYSWCYRNYRQKYAYNPQKPESHERNAQLKRDLDAAWEAVLTV